MREFHLFDFPENIYVGLDNSFRKKLFSKCISKIGTKYKLAKYLNVDYKAINNWINGYRRMYGKLWKEFIPLHILKKLSDLSKISKREIENNTKAYKIKGGKGLVIKNPILPIKETPALIRLLSHFIGDGYGKTYTVYANKCRRLCIQFQKDLAIFGEVYTHLIYNKIKNIYILSSLKVIPDLIRHFYKIDLETFNSKVPKRLYSLPKKYAAEFLKAFIDDEGNIEDSGMRIYSGNKKLIKGIYKLIRHKFPNIEVKFCKYSVSAREYKLRIPKSSLPTFVKEVGDLYHPIKNERLHFILKLIKQPKKMKGNKWYETKQNILKFIKNNPSTIYELSKEFMITESAIRMHLNNLGKDKLINPLGKTDTRAFIWGSNGS